MIVYLYTKPNHESKYNNDTNNSDFHLLSIATIQAERRHFLAVACVAYEEPRLAAATTTMTTNIYI